MFALFHNGYRQFKHTERARDCKGACSASSRVTKQLCIAVFVPISLFFGHCVLSQMLLFPIWRLSMLPALSCLPLLVKAHRRGPFGPAGAFEQKPAVLNSARHFTP
jgi:hypothetical protein